MSGEPNVWGIQPADPYETETLEIELPASVWASLKKTAKDNGHVLSDVIADVLRDVYDGVLGDASAKPKSGRRRRRAKASSRHLQAAE